jgi:hypothetical protein
MNDNTCKNCKWWGRSWRAACGASQSDFVGGGIKSSLEKKMTLQDPAGFNIWAFAADDHNLVAELVTGPDFGCVKFTPKAEGET